MANLTIESACDILTNETLGLAVDRLAVLSTKILNASGEKCLDYTYSKMIRKLRNVTWASEEAEGGNIFLCPYDCCFISYFLYFDTYFL